MLGQIRLGGLQQLALRPGSSRAGSEPITRMRLVLKTDWCFNAINPAREAWRREINIVGDGRALDITVFENVLE